MSSALADTVQDAKRALKSARRAAKVAKATWRALKAEAKSARKQHKRARKQLQVAEEALDQARAAADQAAVSTAPRVSKSKRAPSKGGPTARAEAHAKALPPVTPIAAVALSRPFNPVKLKHRAPADALRPLMPIPSFPSTPPAPTPENGAPTKVLPAGGAR